MLHEHRDEFEERNLFLQLALGLGSASRRLDDLLARYGKPPSEPAREDAGDTAILHFVLGLISFRDRVMSALAAARRPPPPARRRGDEAEVGEVLR